jgi:hypothetical protein
MNRASKQSILCDEQEHLEIQRHKQQALTQNLQHHHHQPTPLGLRKLGAESRRQKMHRRIPPPKHSTNAQHHNL